MEGLNMIEDGVVIEKIIEIIGFGIVLCGIVMLIRIIYATKGHELFKGTILLSGGGLLLKYGGAIVPYLAFCGGVMMFVGMVIVVLEIATWG